MFFVSKTYVFYFSSPALNKQDVERNASFKEKD